MKKALTGSLAVVLLGGLTLTAAEFWEKKDYRKWSEKDCKKLLRDSPWAKQHILSKVYITPLQVGPGNPDIGAAPGALPTAGDDPTLRERRENPRIIYQVQFRSALPVRQAMVRLQQISIDYEKLPQDQQQSFDSQADAFLNREINDVVVYLMYEANIRSDMLDLQRYWQNQTTETLKNRTFLIGRQGRKATIVHYAVAEGGGNTFQFMFPRTIDGELLVGPKDKSLQLEFIHPNIRGQGEERILLDFKVKKMILEDKVVF